MQRPARTLGFSFRIKSFGYGQCFRIQLDDGVELGTCLVQRCNARQVELYKLLGVDGASLHGSLQLGHSLLGYVKTRAGCSASSHFASMATGSSQGAASGERHALDKITTVHGTPRSAKGQKALRNAILRYKGFCRYQSKNDRQTTFCSLIYTARLASSCHFPTPFQPKETPCNTVDWAAAACK